MVLQKGEYRARGLIAKFMEERMPSTGNVVRLRVGYLTLQQRCILDAVNLIELPVQNQRGITDRR